MPPGDDRHILERRVLLVTPTRRDGEITSGFLSEAGLPCVVCEGLPHLAKEMERGAGAVLITEEAIVADGMRAVLDVLDRQPAWSDLPVVLLMRGGVTAG